MKYGNSFQLLREIGWDGGNLAIGQIASSPEHRKTSSLLHPAVLDNALQILLVQATKGATDSHPACVLAERKPTPGLSNEASVSVVGGNGKVLCNFGHVTMAPISSSQRDNAAGKSALLYGIDWKPHLCLMDRENMRQACDASAFTRDEAAMARFRKVLEPTLNLVLGNVLQDLSDTEREGVPEHLRCQVRWMDHHIAQLHGANNAASYGQLPTEMVQALLARLVDMYPSWEIFPAIAKDLRAILLGEVDPLGVAFDDRGLAEKFYADIFNTICDDRFHRLFDLISHENPTMRVLEVGAGTGGMTEHVLSTLGGLEDKQGGNRFSEYTYTDISPSFFEGAQQKFRAYDDRMSFIPFDLDRRPLDQGLEEGSYDLIVAGCVLHATKELNVTLGNLRRLLKPQGRLVLLEVVAPRNVTTNFAFGVLPGWWSAAEEFRVLSPTLAEHQWDQVLRDNGFTGNDLALQDYSCQDYHTFSLLVTSRKEPTHNGLSERGRLYLVLRCLSDEKALQLARAVQTLLAHYDSEVVPLHQAKTVSFRELDYVIVLVELDTPVLSTLSDTTYADIKDVIKRAHRILWTASAAVSNPRFAEFGLMRGFLRTIRSENLDKQIVTLSIEDGDIHHAAPGALARHLANVFSCAFETKSRELEYRLRDGELSSARLVARKELNGRLAALLAPQVRDGAWKPGPPVKLAVGRPGFLDGLEFVADPAAGEALGPREVEIEARAWGLNFRDVVVALGRLPGDDLGYDCAGVVTRVGPGCGTGLRVGDRVCGGSIGAMRSHPRAHMASFVKMPDSLSFAAAASIFTPAVTAYYSLMEVARLQKGEKILVHSAAGATGQMAIQIARIAGADIYATVGMDEKKQYLVDRFGIPADHIFYSRDNSFARGIMRVTKGSGVDVLLNSLSGDGMRASWECMAPFGRFIEIGKADIVANSGLPMENFARNVTFSAVDLHFMGEKHMGRCQELFPFRHLQSGKSTGRIVISVSDTDTVRKRLAVPVSWQFDPEASYVIAGGTGGIGRAIAAWMADRGARHLILLSRNGDAAPAAAKAMAELRARGVNVTAPRCDVSSSESLASVLDQCRGTMPAVKGCVQSAMALQDASFDEMTHAQWETTVRSKVQASWNLHEQLPATLDFFVLLSSLAGIYGSISQANYAAGCAYQDALARHRTWQGLKAVSLDLGWLRTIGVVAENAAYQRARQFSNDMEAIEAGELMALLEIYCDPKCPVLPPAESQLLVGAVTPANCLSRGQPPPILALRPLFSSFSLAGGARSSTAPGDGGASVDHALLFRRAAGLEERSEILVRGLASKLARAMSIAAEDVVPAKQLSDYGVDS
ncbi:polyketide synthase PksD [Apiospora hydei]|uniref:Polyketide synthase PksD n=1 Tax=Apiospora hydei TaxID=1337664 RepID=A0ABR1V460_9PEZI